MVQAADEAAGARSASGSSTATSTSSRARSDDPHRDVDSPTDAFPPPPDEPWRRILRENDLESYRRPDRRAEG